ncbi:ribosome-recycling factor [Mycoplasmopsis agassizii]|uniref:Ribosome recycling factor n=1 Tax=Mycoplasmopsis agassizii TaxID=33922 RepID=A0ABX4H6K2_9BACT|nr:ribosome-recycling factor [Mycoplasmopsis agassizii]PAF55505.1 ribosome recycling factor [Mycoplasmopsis agassizii]SMC18016.1 ribosome recycling factor [Mycoplasmopsis agassizii]
MFDFDELNLEIEMAAEEKIKHFEIQLSKISTGAANPALLRNVKVMYYDELTPLETIAAISVPEAMQLLIKPFDVSSTKDIMVGLNKSGLDINPSNEGDKIRITFQPLTTQRKKELAKTVHKFAEEAKIAIRLIRQNANNKITKAADVLSKDVVEDYKNDVQLFTEKMTAKINQIAAEKEAQLMKV